MNSKRLAILWVLLIGLTTVGNAQDFKTQQEQSEFMQSRVDSVAIGNQIPAFTMLNERLEEITFGDLNAKVVVVDVWGTWCKPCIVLSPAFEKSKEEFKDDNVLFLSVSIDQDKDKWINYVEDHQVNYDRYWVGKDFNNPIVWFTFSNFEFEERQVWGQSVPKFILIDKNGKVTNIDFGQPGMPSFKKAIKKALKN